MKGVPKYYALVQYPHKPITKCVLDTLPHKLHVGGCIMLYQTSSRGQTVFHGPVLFSGLFLKTDIVTRILAGSIV
jgi:hypothetical protein